MLSWRVWRSVGTALFLVGGLACGKALGPEFNVEPSLDAELVLRVGETVEVSGTDGLQLTFGEVKADSRCPSNELILCAWEGDAEAIVRAEQGPLPPVDLALHTSAQFDTAADYGPFRISRVRLDPYPETAGPIPIEQYRLVLIVSER